MQNLKVKINITNLCRAMEVMLKSGIPVHRALQFLADGSEPNEASVYLKVTKAIERGASFSEALLMQPEHFPPLIISSAKIGERTGRLDTILCQVADLLERNQKLRGKIRAALTYPGFLCILTFVIVLVVVFFVLPKEAEMLEGLGAEMPLLTKILVKMVDIVLHPVGIATILMTGVVTWFLLKKADFFGESFIATRDRWVLTVPGLGTAIFMAASIRLLYGLSALLESGASLTWALGHLLPTLENKTLEEKLLRVIHSIAQGASPAASMAEEELLPSVAIGLFAVAEEEGNLDLACRQAAEILEMDLNITLETLANLLEPAALLFMGLVVGFVVLSTALPTVQLLQNL